MSRNQLQGKRRKEKDLFRAEFKKIVLEPHSLELLTQIELVKNHIKEEEEEFRPCACCTNVESVKRTYNFFTTTIILHSEDLLRFFNNYCKEIDFWIAFKYDNFWKVYHKDKILCEIPEENYFILNQVYESNNFYNDWVSDLVSSTGIKLSPKISSDRAVRIYQELFNIVEKQFNHMLPQYKDIINNIIKFYNL